MTKLEYYGLLVKTSLSGGFPANEEHNGTRGCRYRCVDGKKCAIGLIMPDYFYSPDIEGKLVQRMMTKTTIPEWVPAGVTVEQLIDVQTAHDDASFAADPWNHEAFADATKKILDIGPKVNNDCFAN